MFESKEVLFGTVIACDANNNLTVELENGEKGRVTADEIGRREMKENSRLNWMIGRRLGFFAGETDQEGYRILSGKAYENDQYEEIIRAFRAKERNVYQARLVSVTKDGKLAFYTLAQGVNASVTVNDFAYSRICSFNDVNIPRELTVAIKDIDVQGRIHLYAKLAFGDFASSIERLSLAADSVVDGFVSGYVPSNGDSIVTIAPNLTVLATHADMGNWVKVQISRVNCEEQRLKGEIIEEYRGLSKQFPFSDWCIDAADYPPYVDISEFDGRIGPRNRGDNNSPIIPHKASEVQISYDLKATASPFALRDGEIGIRAPLNGGSVQHIVFEAQRGYLSEYHMLAAKAVNDLKFTTSWQVQRYLHLKHGLVLSERTLWSILNRLIKHDIIHTMNFSLNGQRSVQNILYPGATLYQSYTGQTRSLPSWCYSAEPDTSQIKCYLSANQLLLGAMHSWNNIKEVDTRAFIFKGDLRIRPRYKIIAEDGGIVYLESARSSWMDDGMIGKLERYQTYLSSTGEQAKVVITLENESLIEPFAQRVADLRLSFVVQITSDLQCLPAPVLREVPAYLPENGQKREGFISRIMTRFKEAKSA